MSSERAFTIEPIPGMEVIQKNFMKLVQEGDVIAKRYDTAPKVYFLLELLETQ